MDRLRGEIVRQKREYQEEMDNLVEENERQDYLISILIRDNMKMKALLGPS